jgi:hypothetical protein
MSKEIRNKIFNLFEGTAFAGHFQNPDGLWTGDRSGLTISDVYGHNPVIIPSVGRFDSTNYLYQAISNFESGDSSGYIEVSFYNAGSGVSEVFNSYSESASARYFRVYQSANKCYLDIRQNITTVFQNRFYITADLSVGWHIVRWISSAGAYTAQVDGGAVLTVGAGITLSLGANDGRWLDLVTLRGNIAVGMYKDSGGIHGQTNTNYVRYVDYNNKHKWIANGQGTKVFDMIGTNHFTWTGTAHQSFNASADTLLLDSGYSLWQKYGEIDEYVPYKTGAPYDVSSFLAGYEKVTDHEGSATLYNMAPSLIDFDPDDSHPAVLAVLDRSSVTYQTAASRASAYYDASNTYRYHSSELANPITYNALFNVGYRGMFYSSINTTIYKLNYRITAIKSLILFTEDQTSQSQRDIMNRFGSNVFCAIGPGARYDINGYNLVQLTDISQFGASTLVTPEENFAHIQKAAYYPYNETMKFGVTGDEYVISQPIDLLSLKTYQIDSTIKIKNGTLTMLSQDYVAGDDHIHVVATAGFNIGEWISVCDDDTTIYYALGRCASCFWITDIDRENRIIYFDHARGVSSIYTFLTSKNARTSHTQNVLLADTKSYITLTGTGWVDGNYLNQHGMNACLPSQTWFEEHKAGSGFTAWCCDHITITNLNFIRGLRHNINCTGYNNATRTTNLTIQNVHSTFAYNKNCNIRYCTTVLVEDYVGNDAIEEDGLMFYLHNYSVTINRISCNRNGRFGVGWNGGQPGSILGDTISTSGNHDAGVYSSAANLTYTNVTMSDRLVLSNAYDNGNDISITNIAISNHIANASYYGCIVGLFGAITNVALNELSITGCTGIGIKATSDYTPLGPPVNVDITGGGIYTHTGTKFDIVGGSDVVFSDFDNYP